MKEALVALVGTIISGLFSVLIAKNAATKARTASEQAEAQERALFRQRVEAELEELHRICAEQAAHLKEHNGYGKLFADYAAEIKIKLAKLETKLDERT